MTPELFRDLVAQAAQAPSVHNVQPARWRYETDAVTLFEDPSVRLAAGDPTGWDAAMSLGAAVEVFCLSASRHGLMVDVAELEAEMAVEGRLPKARLTWTKGAAPDPLADAVGARRSWRSAFVAPTEADRAALREIGSETCAVLTGPETLSAIALWNDQASLTFQRDRAFRAELLSWMRLSPKHPRWARDGLNADAMGMGRVEAWGAGLVLGPFFAALDALGLAKPLVSEAKITSGAAGIMVVHGPSDISGLDAGRLMCRAWLKAEAAGMGAAVMAALVDDPQSRDGIAALLGLGSERRLITTLRAGRRPPHPPVPRARLPIEDLIV